MPHLPRDAPHDATRTERDSLGIGISPPRRVGAITCAAARTNQQLGRLEDWRSDAIEEVAQSVMEGRHDDKFVLARIQGGGGTSTYMNANEIISNLALEELRKERGCYQAINPIDHVNHSQSTLHSSFCQRSLPAWRRPTTTPPP